MECGGRWRQRFELGEEGIKVEGRSDVRRVLGRLN